VDVRHIRLDLNVDLPNRTATARATLDVRTLRPVRSLTLDAVDFEVKKVERHFSAEAAAVPFSHDGKRLVLDLDPAWPADRSAKLVIDYVIRDPKAGLHFFGPSKTEPDVPLTVWSQGEPTTNRHWIPCFDHPDEKQTSEMFVTVAEGFDVLSNGRLVGKKSSGDKSVTFHWKQEQPHVSYLMTLVVGQFDIVEEKWKDLPVLYYVPKGRKEEIARTFGRTREMLDLFSRKFGID
jgi:aminopeptidase N